MQAAGDLTENEIVFGGRLSLISHFGTRTYPEKREDSSLDKHEDRPVTPERPTKDRRGMLNSQWDINSLIHAFSADPKMFSA